MSHKILIVDDEDDIRVLISYNLQKEGYEVHTATNGEEGVRKTQEIRPDIVLLDIMMPVMDGIEACEKIRSNDELNDILICFLTARGEDYSQIAGFDAGADYYITKPIKPKVLLSRIASMLRRTQQLKKIDSEEEPVKQGLFLDKDQRFVLKDNNVINLPRKEFELLALLMSKPGYVFKRDQIMSDVWGDEVIVGDRTIDVHIRKLREKIGDNYIITIKGVGYKFKNQ